MAVRQQPWPAGTPAWVDIMVTDPEQSKRFYSAVLGWAYTDPEPEFGGYANALVDGTPVAGICPPMEGMEDTPHLWTTYLAVEDAEQVHEAATAGGASTICAPMPVGDQGRMAVYADPTGAVFGTWEAGRHTGFGSYDVPGAVAWSEAMCGDYDAGAQFYTNVFGFGYTDMSGNGMRYAMFSVPGGERPAGGIGQVEQGTAPYWSVVFQTDDTDAACVRVSEAGGTVTTAPFDFEFGRLAVATGPDGEEFGLITNPSS